MRGPVRRIHSDADAVGAERRVRRRSPRECVASLLTRSEGLPGLRHLANSGGVLNHPEMALDVLGKYSEPEEIAEMVLFLAGTAGSFMTGQVVGTRMRYGA